MVILALRMVGGYQLRGSAALRPELLVESRAYEYTAARYIYVLEPASRLLEAASLSCGFRHQQRRTGEEDI